MNGYILLAQQTSFHLLFPSFISQFFIFSQIENKLLARSSLFFLIGLGPERKKRRAVAWACLCFAEQAAKRVDGIERASEQWNQSLCGRWALCAHNPPNSSLLHFIPKK